MLQILPFILFVLCYFETLFRPFDRQGLNKPTSKQPKLLSLVCVYIYPGPTLPANYSIY